MTSLPLGSVEQLTGLHPFLVLAPHPDDETLGCAGLLCAARAAGVPLRILVMTDGAQSHPRSKSYPAKRLTELRQGESRAAAACCGIPSSWVEFLGLPDTKVPTTGPTFECAVAAVCRRARGISAASLFVTWRGDPHCDHEAVYDIARCAADRLGARLWAYPVWGWELPVDHDVSWPTLSGLRLDIDPWLAAKQRAIDCHRSQTTRLIDDDPEGFVMTKEMIARFCGRFEYFVDCHP